MTFLSWNHQSHFEIDVIDQCTYMELKGLVLEELLEEDPDVATDVYDMLGTFILFFKMPDLLFV